MHIEPLHDVVIIKPQIIEQTEGGIIIPIASEDFAEDIGTVHSCGPGRIHDGGYMEPMHVKPGDKVLFSTHGHQVTKVNGEELIVLRQDSIIGVFK